MEFKLDFITKEPAATKLNNRGDIKRVKRRVLGSSPAVEKNWEAVLVVGRSEQDTFRKPSEHHQPTLEQGNECPSAHMGRCCELETYLGVYHAVTPMQLGWNPASFL